MVLILKRLTFLKVCIWSELKSLIPQNTQNNIFKNRILNTVFFPTPYLSTKVLTLTSNPGVRIHVTKWVSTPSVSLSVLTSVTCFWIAKLCSTGQLRYHHSFILYLAITYIWPSSPSSPLTREKILFLLHFLKNLRR